MCLLHVWLSKYWKGSVDENICPDFRLYYKRRNKYRYEKVREKNDRLISNKYQQIPGGNNLNNREHS